VSSADARADHIEVLDVMSDLLLGIGEGSPLDAFFSSLCEAICRLASMQRAILFQYDSVRRRVRPVGAHNIELERFADLHVTVDSVPVARQSLAEDRVLEVVGAADFDIPESLRELLEGRLLVCTPMAAAGRYVGVVLSERDPLRAAMSDEERHLLWTLGKAIAMASVARRAASYSERSRQLQQRIYLAREIHEGVLQRLFGVSLALAGEEPLDRDAQRRCAEEVQAALSDLRAVLQRPLGHSSPPTSVTFAEELRRLQGAHPELHIELRRGDPSAVPATLQALSQSILIEAVRNANKHAAARSVDVCVDQHDGAFTLEIRNDGALCRDGAKAGIGLRLATLEALQHGGVLEFGECEPGIWQVRMVAPTA
jgi:signal transduction histidine kinase